jgi:hypothetical protein
VHTASSLASGTFLGPTVTAATLVDRALASISTVKAFNVAPFEQRTFDELLNRWNQASKKCGV